MSLYFPRIHSSVFFLKSSKQTHQGQLCLIFTIHVESTGSNQDLEIHTGFYFLKEKKVIWYVRDKSVKETSALIRPNRMWLHHHFQVSVSPHSDHKNPALSKLTAQPHFVSSLFQRF